MLSLQPQQCAEECPSPAPPARVTRTSLSPAGTAGSAHARASAKASWGHQQSHRTCPGAAGAAPGSALATHCGTAASSRTFPPTPASPAPGAV